MALVGWIQAHTRIQYDLGGVRQWQWPPLLQCWAMEQAGIHTEFARDPERAMDLLEQAGVPSPA
eukprot:1794390-Lingulodinium_polyedra.AAC.1